MECVCSILCHSCYNSLTTIVFALRACHRAKTEKNSTRPQFNSLKTFNNIVIDTQSGTLFLIVPFSNKEVIHYEQKI